jgi:hypothetical protein
VEKNNFKIKQFFFPTLFIKYIEKRYAAINY